MDSRTPRGRPAPINRRQLLSFLSAVGVSVYAGGCNDTASPYARTAAPTRNPQNLRRKGDDDDHDCEQRVQKVLVIGGGLSGLSAAYELKKLGHKVTVLEAQDHVGGRVRSLRDGYVNGQVNELGAVRIPDVHEHTLGYVEELGLELEIQGGGDALFYLRGNRFIHPNPGEWPLTMTADEQELGLDMWAVYIAAYFDEAGNPREGTFPTPDVLAAYDNKTWTEFLESKGASPDWIYLYTADNGTEISLMGALPWYAQEVADQDWLDTYHVKGGNDQIPRGIADLLGDDVKLGCVVTRIEHDDDGVKVTYTRNGKSRTKKADHLVCAIPFTLLRDVELSPAFPDDKMQAIDELFMMAASRGFYQTATRFWEEEGIGGLKIAKTDTVAERLWDISHFQSGNTGVFFTYMQHENAAAMAAVAPEDRQAWMDATVSTFFPQITEQTLHFSHKCWGEDPWVKGAWCDILPGQWWMMSVIGRAEGRVHFCGEHTSIWAGWMQGAIESAKRCAVEIDEA